MFVLSHRTLMMFCVGFFFSINLMKQLISSSNLFVMQVEMDVYTALKKVLSKGLCSCSSCFTKLPVLALLVFAAGI